MRLALIKGIIIAVMFLAIASASIVAVNTPHPEVATPDEISTPDQATIDEVTTTATVHMTTAKAIETTVAGTTKPTEPKPTEAQTTEPIVTEPQEEENDNYNSGDEDLVYDDSGESVDDEPKEVEYLLDIDNPDPNYTPQSFSLSDSERYQIACVVMGEFGGGGFTGCALIAQSIRDAMAEYGYSASSVTSSMGYYGYNSSPNSSSYEAVDWIFDGNAAVQHRILYMNNSPGGWHGTQQYILDYQGVWFFDKW